MDLQGNAFIVTGGASGLGAATARMLVQGGARVVIADLKNDEGAAIAEELGAAARYVRTDVADDGSAVAAVAAAVQAFGGLAGLVNCAGIVHGEKVVGKDGPHALPGFARAITINLVGTFNMIRVAAHAMSTGTRNAGGERGVIVNTASVAAFDGQIGQAAYAASKGGIVAMTLPIARELARFGIRVMTIAPGPADTPMLSRLRDDIRASLEAQVPFPSRLARPGEYAMLVKHIVENPYLNGEVIRLDGALRMGPR